DWHSPNPIPFLTVAPGNEFLFAVLPRRPEVEQDCKDAETAARWLKQALATLGAGAKTAAGYGVFREKADKSEPRQGGEDEPAFSREKSPNPVPDPAGRRAFIREEGEELEDLRDLGAEYEATAVSTGKKVRLPKEEVEFR
ncbi:MAG: type III-B CRISPR module RAMP protein Cmr6, partial [Caldilineae bacterium]